MARVQSGNLLPVEYNYDVRGRVVQAKQGNKQIQMAYDSANNLSSIKDALGRVSYFKYDKAGRLQTEQRPDGKIVRYQYDSNGNLVSLVPADRLAHVFSFDPNSELLNAYLPPLLPKNRSTPTRYEYNLDKQLTKVVQPDRLFEFNYDVNSGVLKSVVSGEARRDYLYSQENGQLVQVKSQDNMQTDFQYVGPLLSQVKNAGAVNSVINFSFNKDFLVSKRNIVGSNADVNFGYDNDSLLVKAGEMDIARDTQTGAIAGVNLGLTKEVLGYSNQGDLQSSQFLIKQKPFYEYKLERDVSGRIVAKSEIYGGKLKLKHAYAYDIQGRLVETKVNGIKKASYKYDANGNRLSQDLFFFKGDDHYKYDAQDRLISSGDSDYSYNLNGELIAKYDKKEKAKTEYSYDGFGNLKRVKITDEKKFGHRGHHHQHKQSKVTEIDYILDTQGRRIGKKVNGELKQAFVYESDLGIAAELDGGGQVVKQFIYGSKPNVPDYMITKEGKYRIYSDHLGSPRFIVDIATGKVKDEMNYDEFGNLIDCKYLGLVPFGFAGGLYDNDTGLVRFGVRDYDPTIGRWLSKDPIGFAGGDTNLYAYVGGDPLSYIDPEGTFLVPVAIGIFLGMTLTATPLEESLGRWGEAIRVAVGGLIGGSTAAFMNGTEFVIGGWRFAPFGNRTGGLNNQLPHYHRRVVNPISKETIPGQGIGRHRPWDTKSTDKTFCERF